uniref:Uncharacterized protein n=1 Tax=Arundo donax TaxID=35708 RepID=A0A0A8YEW8_ARUDO
MKKLDYLVPKWIVETKWMLMLLY